MDNRRTQIDPESGRTREVISAQVVEETRTSKSGRVYVKRRYNTDGTPGFFRNGGLKGVAYGSNIRRAYL